MKKTIILLGTLSFVLSGCKGSDAVSPSRGGSSSNLTNVGKNPNNLPANFIPAGNPDNVPSNFVNNIANGVDVTTPITYTPKPEVIEFLKKVTLVDSPDNSIENSIIYGETVCGAMSTSGRYVAFTTWFVGNFHKIFRKDLQTGIIQLVNADSSGNPLPSADRVCPHISSDGRYIMYLAKNADTAQRPYRKDMVTGEVREVLNQPQMKFDGLLNATMNESGTKVMYGCNCSDGHMEIKEMDFTTGITTVLFSFEGYTHYPTNLLYGKDDKTIFFADTGTLNGVSICPGNACAFYRMDVASKKIELISNYSENNSGYQYGGGVLSADKSYIIYPVGDKNSQDQTSKIDYRVKNLTTNLDVIVDSPDDTLFSSKHFGCGNQQNAMYGDNEIAIVNLDTPKIKTRFNGPVLVLKDFKAKKYYLITFRKLIPSMKIFDETISYFSLSKDKKSILANAIIGTSFLSGNYLVLAKLDDMKIEISAKDLGIE